MCNCNNGVSGLGVNIDWTKIGVKQATEVIQNLSQQDLVTILKDLPADVQKKICIQGVQQEVTSYIPWIVGGGVALLVAFYLMK